MSPFSSSNTKIPTPAATSSTMTSSDALSSCKKGEQSLIRPSSKNLKWSRETKHSFNQTRRHCRKNRTQIKCSSLTVTLQSNQTFTVKVVRSTTCVTWSSLRRSSSSHYSPKANNLHITSLKTTELTWSSRPNFQTLKKRLLNRIITRPGIALAAPRTINCLNPWLLASSLRTTS